ncbi:hypothetical protein ABFO09_17690, partial [Bordetella pertussis]
MAAARRLLAAGARVVIVDLPGPPGGEGARGPGPGARFAPAGGARGEGVKGRPLYGSPGPRGRGWAR